MTSERPHVVILGGGFGGLNAARALRKAPVRITLVDRRNYHLFQPLLYQVATAGLSPSDIAAPLRRVLRGQRNVDVRLDEATSVDVGRKRIHLSQSEMAYDFCIVATGASHSYFGHDEWAEHAPGLKTVEDALEIRRRVLLAFEMADRETDAVRRRAWLTFVIVGGGPTGVEMAGALAEIARFTMAKDFRNINPTEARVILVEGGQQVLGAYPSALADKARQQLERLGVHVWTGTRVTGIDGWGVFLGQERIEARTVMWAAGVAASPLATSLGVPLDRSGRVIVCDDLSLPGRPEVFIIGDLAAVRSRDGAMVPGVASAAVQEGRHAARSITGALDGRERTRFFYRNKGALATIGRAAAVADFGFARLSGLGAWLSWLFIHVLFLVGFRNRLSVVSSWAWSYFTLDRGARLITGTGARRPSFSVRKIQPPHASSPPVNVPHPPIMAAPAWPTDEKTRRVNLSLLRPLGKTG